MTNCIFCQIVEGKSPCYKVYEDDNCLGILDIFPRVKGHVLLIPKKHYQWIYDLPEQDFKEVWGAGQKIAQALEKTFKPEFVSYITYGLDVLHAHIHIMPRNKEHMEFSPPQRISFSKEEFAKIANQIKDVLSKKE